jgi:hypothetical protein
MGLFSETESYGCPLSQQLLSAASAFSGYQTNILSVKDDFGANNAKIPVLIQPESHPHSDKEAVAHLVIFSQ